MPDDDGGAIHAARAAHLRLVFEQIPGAVWTTDRELRITQGLGRPPMRERPCVDWDRVPGSGVTVYDLVGTRDPSEPMVAHHLAALAGRATHVHYTFEERCYEVRLAPSRDERGDVVGCLGAAIDVTERRALEERLERSEARLAEAQRVAHVGSFEWDLARDVVTWSPELRRIYGLDPDTTATDAATLLAHVEPEDRTRVKSLVFDACPEGGAFTVDFQVRRGDGERRTLHSRGDVVCGEGGEPVRVVGCCWDVTERVAATRALEESISLLQATLDATADGLLVVDRGGRIAAYNQRFVDLWRLPPERVAQRDDEALLQRVAEELDDPEGFLLMVRELYGEPTRESFDVLRFRDGRVFERYSRPQRLHGEVCGRVWSFRDVSERERLLERTLFLADADRLLVSLELEPALAAVAQRAIPYLGDACVVDLLVHGAPRRAISISRDPGRQLDTELHRSVLAGHSAIYEHEGSSLLAVPLTGHEGVVGAITFCAAPRRRYGPAELDVAEELARGVSLAFERARLCEELKEALRAREEFISVAAHELRGPVTALHLGVQTLARRRSSTEAVGRIVSILEREDQRLVRFVDELLDVGRARSGRMHFDYAEVDLAEVVRAVAARHGRDLTRSGSSLSITTAGELIGQWDRFRLEQVVTNLLSNAIKFGLGRPIELAARGAVDRVILEVVDHGIGIAPEMQERVFRPFERGVSTRHYGGLGLGLYIVRTIVEGMGGVVRLESNPGQVTRFTVELPRTRTP